MKKLLANMKAKILKYLFNQEEYGKLLNSGSSMSSEKCSTMWYEDTEIIFNLSKNLSQTLSCKKTNHHSNEKIQEKVRVIQKISPPRMNQKKISAKESDIMTHQEAEESAKINLQTN